MNAVCAKISCNCGKVKILIDSPSALRFVCYCRDCRGYYNTLNSQAIQNDLPEVHPARLDPFGGVDVTQIYPDEIKLHNGQQHLRTVLIREKSPYHRTYCKSCSCWIQLYCQLSLRRMTWNSESLAGKLWRETDKWKNRAWAGVYRFSGFVPCQKG